MNLSNKNQILQLLVKYFSVLLVLCLVIIISASTAFLLWPKYKEIKEQQILSYDQKKQELAQKQLELAALQKLDEQLAQISDEEVERLNSFLPRGINNPAIFRQLERIGQERNLVITMISMTEGGGAGFGSAVSAAPTSDKLKTLTISVSFSGDQDYEKLKKLLATIENNLMILDLTSLSYSPEQRGYSLNLRTYYLLP